MDRASEQRISKVEKLLGQAEESLLRILKKRQECDAMLLTFLLPRALPHATAVAAIVLHGKPKIDEPLRRAWLRTLRHYDVAIPPRFRLDYKNEREHEHEHAFEVERGILELGYENELRTAHEQLYPVIIKDANRAERFRDIFRTAPIWLLEFTHMQLDAFCLKFDLPEMSDKQVWGDEGFEEFMRHPLLPLGTMGAGKLLPDVPHKQGVPPAKEEAYRRARRMDDFLAQRYPDTATHPESVTNEGGY